MTIPVVTGATSERCCGDVAGDCAPGEECLPSNFIDPDDCAGGCGDGEECLPSDFIDPDDCPTCTDGGCFVFTDPLDDLDNWEAETNVTNFAAAAGELTFESDAAGNWSIQTPGHFIDGLTPGETYTIRMMAWTDGPARDVEYGVVEYDASDAFLGVQSPLGTTTVATAAPGTLVAAQVTLGADTTSIRLILRGVGAAGAGETVHVTDLFVNFGDNDGTPGSACPSCLACSCAEGSNAPFCIAPSADDPDTVIMALSPHSYFLMDGSGALDISGNGHNGLSSIGTVTYGVASLSSKVPANQATAFTAGGSIRFTPPVSALTDPAQPWALAMLLQIDAYDSGVGGSGPFSFMSWSNAQPPKMGHFIETPGRLTLWTDSTFGDIGTFTQSRDAVFAIDEPHVLIINNFRGAGTGINTLMIEAWIDGVLVCTSCSDNSGVDGGIFSIGRLPGGGPFFGAVDLTFSNLALFDRALTVAEIKAISEALMDASILANAWVPT